MYSFRGKADFYCPYMGLNDHSGCISHLVDASKRESLQKLVVKPVPKSKLKVAEEAEVGKDLKPKDVYEKLLNGDFEIMKQSPKQSKAV